MEKLTPMLQQYKSIKADYPDCILFFRLGDFYEMFFDDAKTAASLLDLVLTARNAGKAGKVPMCGIPHHAAENYIGRLIKAGYKVAICDQLEDPTLAKGIVKRGITRIITSGTFIDEQNSDSRYLSSICFAENNKYGLAFVDINQGNIKTNQYDNEKEIIELIAKLKIYECIYPESEAEKIKKIFSAPVLKRQNISLSPFEDWHFNNELAYQNLCQHFKTQSLRGYGIENQHLAIAASGALLEYIREMGKIHARHIHQISLYTENEYVYISAPAVVGLEMENLFNTINYTLTAMGKRNLKFWLYHPLKDKEKIIQRQKAVKLLKENSQLRQTLAHLLKGLSDLEKCLSRISYGYTNPKDFLALRTFLIRLPEFKKLLQPWAGLIEYFNIPEPIPLCELLIKAINADMPLNNYQTKFVAKGYNTDLDGLREIRENGNNWLKKLQQKEIERTGINSLKIGYNRVFGYYIEITKANLSLVPKDYIRRQTLTNAERFITPELKTFEEKMLTAEEKIIEIESKIIEYLRNQILDNSAYLQKVISIIAGLDSLYSLSILSLKEGYTLPKINNDFVIDIKEGRHPAVEEYCNGKFVPNDCFLNNDDNCLLVITGPNMAGKSTYIRQVAILVILAQIGSYLPAEKANIGLVDKIFTRIGAHDEITKGQSTFMVEMTETAGILNNLSERSLVVLDEIGRGTSTFDGLSLAWAVAEFIHDRKVRTLFATHFHELTALSQEKKGVKNYNIAVKEWKDQIIFLHKIIPGGTDDSYGIYVAQLAGVPYPVIKRAKEILTQLEINNQIKEQLNKYSQKKENQLFLFNNPSANSQEEVLNKLKEEILEIDLNNTTPLAALDKIYNWQKKLKKE